MKWRKACTPPPFVNSSSAPPTSFDSWLTVDDTSAKVTEQVLYDVLDMLKEQVRHQGWKDRYD